MITFCFVYHRIAEQKIIHKQVVNKFFLIVCFQSISSQFSIDHSPFLACFHLFWQFSSQWSCSLWSQCCLGSTLLGNFLWISGTAGCCSQDFVLFVAPELLTLCQEFLGPLPFHCCFAVVFLVLGCCFLLPVHSQLLWQSPGDLGHWCSQSQSPVQMLPGLPLDSSAFSVMAAGSCWVSQTFLSSCCLVFLLHISSQSFHFCGLWLSWCDRRHILLGQVQFQ